MIRSRRLARRNKKNHKKTNKQTNKKTTDVFLITRDSFSKSPIHQESWNIKLIHSKPTTSEDNGAFLIRIFVSRLDCFLLVPHIFIRVYVHLCKYVCVFFLNYVLLFLLKGFNCFLSSLNAVRQRS